MTAFEVIRKALMAGFGVQEKVSDFIDEMVKKGELSESQGAKLVKEWSDKADQTGKDISKSISDVIDNAMEKMNLPTKEDVEKLQRKVQTLSARIKKLEEAKGSEHIPEE